MEYLCTTPSCKFDSNKHYVLDIPPEVWEKNNIATMFCPYCGDELKEKDEIPKSFGCLEP